MTEYEVLIEDINPCGGSAYARKTFVEVETDDPIAYVKENSKYPIIETTENADGDLVVVTGNASGYITKFTFTP